MQFNDNNQLGCASGKCPVPCNLCDNSTCPNNPRYNNGMGFLNINLHNSFLPVVIGLGLLYIVIARCKKS